MFLHHQRAVAQPNARLGILLDGSSKGCARDDWMGGIDQHPADHAFAGQFLDAEGLIFKGHDGRTLEGPARSIQVAFLFSASAGAGDCARCFRFRDYHRLTVGCVEGQDPRL